MNRLFTCIAIGLIALGAYWDMTQTLWFMLGAFWGVVNIYFIKQLLVELLIAKPKNFSKITLLTLIKFPLLYGVGFGLLLSADNIPLALIAGFTTVLFLSTQKRLWNITQSEGTA